MSLSAFVSMRTRPSVRYGARRRVSIAFGASGPKRSSVFFAAAGSRSLPTARASIGGTLARERANAKPLAQVVRLPSLTSSISIMYDSVPAFQSIAVCHMVCHVTVTGATTAVVLVHS